MTADIDEAVRVVAEWLGFSPQSDDNGRGLPWVRPNLTKLEGKERLIPSTLHTYEGMGVVLEALRAKGYKRIQLESYEWHDGWHNRVNLGRGWVDTTDPLPVAVLLAASAALLDGGEG